MTMIARRAGIGHYGLDAPGLIATFLAIGLACAAVALAIDRLVPGGGGWWNVATGVLLLVALYATGMGCFMVYSSRIGKVRGRERLIDLVAWRGDEVVLDVGCGRGLMMAAAARRLTTGRAVGIDIWRATDQSFNGPEAALENARLEGVEDRVEVRTADMPFSDASFDVVLSHWAVHNLDAAEDRGRAVAEMARVLRTDGTLILTDIQHRDAYAAALSRLGLSDQRLIVDPVIDAVLNIVTGGSYRPATIVARRRA